MWLDCLGGDDDVRAVACGTQGNRLADAAAGAGNQQSLSMKRAHPAAPSSLNVDRRRRPRCGLNGVAGEYSFLGV